MACRPRRPPPGRTSRGSGASPSPARWPTARASCLMNRPESDPKTAKCRRAGICRNQRRRPVATLSCRCPDGPRRPPHETAPRRRQPRFQSLESGRSTFHPPREGQNFQGGGGGLMPPKRPFPCGLWSYDLQGHGGTFFGGETQQLVTGICSRLSRRCSTAWRHISHPILKSRPEPGRRRSAAGRHGLYYRQPRRR